MKVNQSILKEISPEYSLEGLMLKLKLQSFGHLMQRTDSLEKTLMLGKIEGRRRKGWQDEMVGWHHRLNGHEFEQAPKVGDGQGGLVCCSAWSCKGSETTEQLNWTDTVPCNFVWSYCFNAHLHAVEVWLCTSSYTSGENLDTVSLSDCLLVTATGMCSTGTSNIRAVCLFHSASVSPL